MEIDSLSKPFLGVRFVLFGFDPINEHQVRSKVVHGGGVDVGRYGQNCTHVIVDRITYDDPICVAARNDGRTLITSLWVDHSYDVGMPVDANSVMYRPLKDLNGIPGAKGLVVCLTGYQRQDREDIMTMVGLMGALFSKPLVANKVTHLVCYKFEGEKYELAKKMKKIKLVNHRWLEDCLRDWDLLPEANYDKSGYELEMMEAEAKDSEEEAEDVILKQFGGKDMSKSPHNLKVVVASAHQSPKTAMEVPKMLLNSTVPADPSNVNAKDILSTPVKVSGSHQFPSLDNVNVPEVCGLQDSDAFRDPLLERTPNSTRVKNDLASTSDGAELPPCSESKYSVSYLRKTPWKSPSSISVLKVSGNISGSPEANLGGFKVNEVLVTSSSKVEPEEARTATGYVKTPQRKGESCQEAESSGWLPAKSMTNMSSASSKSQKTSHNATACGRSPIVTYRTKILDPKSPACQPLENNNHFSLHNNYTDDTADLNSALNPHDGSSFFNKKPPTPDLPSFETMTFETGQNENADKAPQSSFRGLKESILATKLDIEAQAGEPQNQQHNIKVSSPKDRDFEMEKSHTPVDLNSVQGGNHKLIAGPLRKKMIAKKTLGSRHAANQKGSIYSSKISSLNDPAVCSNGGEERTDQQKLTRVSATSAPTRSVEAVNELDINAVTGCDDATSNKTKPMDDETESPDEKDELDKQLNHEKSGVVELIQKEDTMMRVEPGDRHAANGTSKSSHDVMAAKEGTNGTELGKTVCRKKFDTNESTSKVESMKGKLNIRKKRPAGKAKSKNVPADVETVESNRDVDKEDTVNENRTEEGSEMDKSVLHPGNKTCGSTVSVMENSMEAEKENRPVVKNQTSSSGVRKSVLKSFKTPEKATTMQEVPNRWNIEPVWFILSGHRLQRKEFQQVIRRLKGRSCRDSHQWSYQATHFIAPDPRRTEKFFAAAASGRWILKTDYLSACNQAGKFLPEEPYEWHKNGLSEDGAINLEAPRKWRLLRERTGHGAFYGMCIIVYGECIAPPLDTLKRVVKAGDGNILATSPPYTRFLKSGVDFAVVSPGMPRVDFWVQEFLKHEVPCVVADYLVEFVCKPGYSLERHVLYNTHAWAEKSFAKMLSKAEETVADLGPPDSCDDNDISCQVCGSTDRGEVMLICGDESGSVGCGVGTHIHCCDPPLENVPEEDWFCPKCTRGRINPSKKRKKGSSSKSE
ncbi:BRCT domain-containing protein At4g02110-like [Pistacia vera]|uniref:BRCT domain-containing protein At4g02110-like n=1 Tax=Pistacia vera TaxID=55513 RepID=UPI001262CE8E|nr:BRCT domain-containing protein At4g02110-like [Pistacia vera]XP_031273938.1 BRCT domain-containing protein At4g02110-like [Pistacia vera]